jgi:hypothetical protein
MKLHSNYEETERTIDQETAEAINRAEQQV